MSDKDVLIINAQEVESALRGREEAVLKAVARAYETHARGQSSLPHSSFLRFPDSDKDRIISLPAYLGDDFQLAGLKWIASVPANVQKGIERASAVMILNRRETGRPEAILEGSIISKQRTAASAALASTKIHRGAAPDLIGFVGCGPINAAVAHFLGVAWPDVKRFMAFDLDRVRAEAFGERCFQDRPGAEFRIAGSLEELLSSCRMTAFATTAIKPYVDDLSICPPSSTLLHVSLRDLTAEVMLAHHNIVDDLDHVCRAQTSIHLASEVAGNRDFVLGSIGEVLLGRLELPPEDDRRMIFTPFGLGVLDLAVAELVLQVAREEGRGTLIPSFLP